MQKQAIRIRRVSRMIQRALWGITWLIPLIVVGFWLSLNAIHSYVQIPLFAFSKYPLPATTLWLGLSVSLLSVGCGMAITINLAKLFSLYSEGKIFTRRNSMCFKRVAISILIYAPVSVVVKTLLTLILTASSKPKVEISVSTTELGYLMVGSMVLVVFWIMEEARRMKNDCDLTI